MSTILYFWSKASKCPKESRAIIIGQPFSYSISFFFLDILGYFRIVKRSFHVQRIKFQVLGTNKSLDPTQVNLGINESPVPMQWDMWINTLSGLMHKYLRMQILRSITVRPRKKYIPRLYTREVED